MFEDEPRLSIDFRWSSEDMEYVYILLLTGGDVVAEVVDVVKADEVHEIYG